MLRWGKIPGTDYVVELQMDKPNRASKRRVYFDITLDLNFYNDHAPRIGTVLWCPLFKFEFNIHYKGHRNNSTCDPDSDCENEG